jgi:hypothetical protein
MDEKLRNKREKNEKLSEDIKILSMLKKVADMDDENLWNDVLNTVTKVINEAKQDADIDEKHVKKAEKLYEELIKERKKFEKLKV